MSLAISIFAPLILSSAPQNGVSLFRPAHLWMRNLMTTTVNPLTKLSIVTLPITKNATSGIIAFVAHNDTLLMSAKPVINKMTERMRRRPRLRPRKSEILGTAGSMGSSRPPARMVRRKAIRPRIPCAVANCFVEPMMSTPKTKPMMDSGITTAPQMTILHFGALDQTSGLPMITAIALPC